MPAPFATAIQVQLKTALLNKGFVKKTYVNGAIVPDPTSLPDKLQEFVDALGNGDNAWFTAWQASQTVLIPVTSTPGLPSTGTLP